MALYEALGYGRLKAQRLKEIARNERFARSSHGSHLPASWRSPREGRRMPNMFGTRKARVAPA
jgi:hypothetical protein